MASKKLTGNDLKGIGFPEGRLIGIALRLVETAYKGKSRQFKLDLLSRVLYEPALYLKHDSLGALADAILTTPEKKEPESLKRNRLPYAVFGLDIIEPGALHQMDIAMKLPVTLAGALMPDAHQGYGLPIGGVLATENAIIPYGVGMDIGCRMCMTVYPLVPEFNGDRIRFLKKILDENTRFGQAAFASPRDHEVLERKEFSEIPILRSLKDKAYEQIGTSGGGNHFVEFGQFTLQKSDQHIHLEPGRYLALLSHSGSRGMGANIARHYTRLAMEICPLPSEAKHLAWLDLDTEAGQEYWLAMNLAGDYASACHHQIHDRMAKALGETALVRLENHHNFAWKEKDHEGREIIVHRKGATPAGVGDIGIIPGSMTSPGFVVRGKGAQTSINSASHGAERQMSRTRAKSTLRKQEVLDHFRQAGVEVIGSGLDEAPMVYKDIYKVMEYQQDLVEILGKFTPKVIRMCGDARFQEVD